MNSSSSTSDIYGVFDYAKSAQFAAEPWADASGHAADDRLRLIRWRDQDKFAGARFLFVGAGANSMAAFGAARTGMRSACFLDDDFGEVTNSSRQLLYPTNFGTPKALAVAENIAREAVLGGTFTGIAEHFPAGLADLPADFAPDIVVCLIDDQAGRVATSHWARLHGIPAVIAGFGDDAHCGYVFLQGPTLNDACIACAYPSISAGKSPCGPATIKTTFLVVAHMLHFIDVALCGQPSWTDPVNERLVDFWGRVECQRFVRRDPACWLCGTEE